MRDYGFVDIENFEKAYKERLKDYLKLKKESKEHPIMLMHLGGIIIECYLKSLIIDKYKIKKKRKNDWYSEESVREIESSRENLKDKDIKAFSYGKGEKDKGNPKHDIELSYSQLRELNDLIALDIDLSKKIQHIKDPLDIATSSFIDLRYETKESFDDIDSKFEKWERDFKYVLNWLKEHSSEVEV